MAKVKLNYNQTVEYSGYSHIFVTAHCFALIFFQPTRLKDLMNYLHFCAVTTFIQFLIAFDTSNVLNF